MGSIRDRIKRQVPVPDNLNVASNILTAKLNESVKDSREDTASPIEDKNDNTNKPKKNKKTSKAKTEGRNKAKETRPIVPEINFNELKGQKIRVSSYLYKEQHAKLKEICKKEGVSFSFLMNVWIESFIKQYES